MPLIDPGRASILAADAWALVHAWGAGGDSWRAWAGEGDATDDCALFARWASRHARELRNANAIDLAEFPDLFCAWASAIPSLRGAALAFAGFAEFSPQQERLLVATAAAGATVTREDTLPSARAHMLRASGASPHDEIACALAWARARAIADPEATIAMSVAGAAKRFIVGLLRGSVRLLAGGGRVPLAGRARDHELLCARRARARNRRSRRAHDRAGWCRAGVSHRGRRRSRPGVCAGDRHSRARRHDEHRPHLVRYRDYARRIRSQGIGPIVVGFHGELLRRGASW